MNEVPIAWRTGTLQRRQLVPTLTTCFCLQMAALSTALAAESVLPITPPGATDVDQALVRLPGLYAGFAALPFDENTHAYDAHGNVVPSYRDLHIRVQIYGPAVYYVYPFQLFGGSLASSVVQPIERLSYSIGHSVHSTQFGLRDAYSDIFYWTRHVGLLGATPGRLPLAYGLTVGAGLAMVLPTGGYSRSNAINLGSNVVVADPNVAATYNTGPAGSLGDNTQLSARIFYGIPLRNPATHYRSGSVFDIDASLTEQFGRLRLGVAGFYQSQTTDDLPNAGRIIVDGNRYATASVGPIVEYFIPDRGIFVKAKYSFNVFRENFVDQNYLVLTTGVKF